MTHFSRTRFAPALTFALAYLILAPNMVSA